MRPMQLNRNTRRLAAVLALMAVAMPAGMSVAHAGDDRPGPCPLSREEDETVRANSRELIRCAVNRWEVPGGAAVALCIAKRESGLTPSAESSDGINKGLFQQHVDFWSGNYDNYTVPNWRLKHSILNGRTNAIVSIRMASDIGWGPWGGRHCG
jgi:hypothetical protein